MPEISVKLSRKAGSAKSAAAKTVAARKPDLDRVSGQATTVSIVCWNRWAVNEVVMPGPGEPFDFICWNCGISGTI